MQFLNDFHHLAFVTADMDRLLDFYKRIFEAQVVLDLEEEGLRHAFIKVGPHTMLHPFQIPGINPPGKQELFQGGRLDHFALNAVSEEAFRELRKRVIEAGASDGVVTDIGPIWTFGYTDPDEMVCEVVWTKPNPPAGVTGRVSEWRTVDMDS